MTALPGRSRQDHTAQMDTDPVETNPELYRTIFENDQVRVLEYRDRPGDHTQPHDHPDSVMYTLSGFRRRLHAGGGTRDVELSAGTAAWLPAQTHAGENTGETETHVIFVELKDRSAPPEGALGPADVVADAEDLPGAVGLHLTDFAAGTVLAVEDVATPVLEVVGTGGLASPCGLDVEGGTVLVAETGAHRVALADSGGWQRFGSPGSGTGEFDRAVDVAWWQGRILVLDSGNCRLVCLDDITGAGWSAYGQRGVPGPGDPAAGSYADPRGLAVDAEGRIWVADPGAGRLTRVAALDGQGWTEVGLPAGARPPLPYAVCRHGDGVAVLDVANRRAVVLDGDGTPRGTLDLDPVEWPAPCFVASTQGLLVVADVRANCLGLFEVSSAGFTLVARLRGSPPDLARPRFTSIGGLA